MPKRRDNPASSTSHPFRFADRSLDVQEPVEPFA
jgi:hypothetical protein